MNSKAAFCFLVLICKASGLSDLYPINLETNISRFVLDSKRIVIPKYEHVLNPSIVRWKDCFLMSFRIFEAETRLATKIGLVFLNKDFIAKSEVYILKIEEIKNINFYINKNNRITIQDPRLIVVNNQLKIVYSNLQIGRMLVADVKFKDNRFFTYNTVCLLDFPRASNYKIEKNWVPFEYGKDLFLTYSISPHSIFKLTRNNVCEEFAHSTDDLRWDYGELRGGTPALLVDGSYIAFFHSSTFISSMQSDNKKIKHYFMGAYRFSAVPPFNITHISPVPIIGKGFYSGKNYKLFKPLKVVFPAGFLFDKDFIWVFFGKQDREIWVTKLDKKELFNNMLPVV